MQAKEAARPNDVQAKEAARLKDEMRLLWTESFADPKAWVDFFFSRAYADEEVMALIDSGTSKTDGRTTGKEGSRASGKEDGRAAARTGGKAPVVSALLLQRRVLLFHGRDLGMAYICGAATRRGRRGEGLMTRLIRAALRAAEARGDTFVGLIPADERLYVYYRRFGLRPSFFVQRRNYTSLHPFGDGEGFRAVDQLFVPGVYEAFERLERQRPCRVLHPLADYMNIIEDNRLDGGAVAAVAREGESDPCAFAWAVPDEATGGVMVRDLLCDAPEAGRAVLRQLRARFADKPFTVSSPAPQDSQLRLEPRGMMRIVNCRRCLEAVAAANPEWQAAIRVHDPVIEANNRVFVASKGAVTEFAAAPDGLRLDLDVDVATLTSIVFSAPKVGEIMGVPSVRPEMSLMLD